MLRSFQLLVVQYVVDRYRLSFASVTPYLVFALSSLNVSPPNHLCSEFCLSTQHWIGACCVWIPLLLFNCPLRPCRGFLLHLAKFQYHNLGDKAKATQTTRHNKEKFDSEVDQDCWTWFEVVAVESYGQWDDMGEAHNSNDRESR